MGKVAPNEIQLKGGRQKRRSKNRRSGKYLKPGALAQIRNSKAASKTCTDLGKKRVAVSNAKRVVASDIGGAAHQNVSPEDCPGYSSPVRSQLDLSYGPLDTFSQDTLQSIPSTPCDKVSDSESRLESLPDDLLVKILCHLHHDQLKAVFHVSRKIRNAVIFARQFYFNYTTPDRTRQEMLNTRTPRPTDHWPFMSMRGGKGIWIRSPHTPKAPKHGPRPPSRLKITEMRQIAAVLFQDSSFSSKCLVPSVLRKPVCKSLASHRVLLYEDELCQAVAQNKLR